MNFEKLLEEAKNGNKDSLVQLIRHYQDRLFRFCFYICKSRPQAQDLVQDVLVKFTTDLKSIRSASSIQGWLRKVAYHSFIDLTRRSESGFLNIEPEVQFEASDLGTVMTVRSVLQKLNADDRSIILLIDLEGFTYEEAAEALSVPLGTIKSRLFTARERFTKSWKKQE